MKYVCPCGYEYDPTVGDPENGIAPGTAFEDLPEDWTCPVCGLDKDAFEKEESFKLSFYGNRPPKDRSGCRFCLFSRGCLTEPRFFGIIYLN